MVWILSALALGVILGLVARVSKALANFAFIATILGGGYLAKDIVMRVLGQSAGGRDFASSLSSISEAFGYLPSDQKIALLIFISCFFGVRILGYALAPSEADGQAKDKSKAMREAHRKQILIEHGFTNGQIP